MERVQTILQDQSQHIEVLFRSAAEEAPTNDQDSPNAVQEVSIWGVLFSIFLIKFIKQKLLDSRKYLLTGRRDKDQSICYCDPLKNLSYQGLSRGFVIIL